MLTDKELFERGKQSIKNKISIKPTIQLNDFKHKLSSIAFCIDLKGNLHYATFDISKNLPQTHVLLNVQKTSYEDVPNISKFYNYMRKSKMTHHYENMLSLKNAMTEELGKFIGDNHDVYIEDMSHYNKFNPDEVHSFGMKMCSNTYVEACRMMQLALAEYCNEHSKTLHVVPLNRRIVRCVCCGAEMIDDVYVDRFVPTVCPYCAQHGTILNLFATSYISSFSSVAVQLLAESLPEGIVPANLEVEYVEDSTLKLQRQVDDEDFDELEWK